MKVKLFREVSFNRYRTNIEFFFTGKIVGKRIHVDKKGLNKNIQDLYEYPFEFNFRFIDLKKEVFTEKVNVQINSKFYCYLNYFKRLKLKYIFQQLWIQQPENIKWIIMAVFAGIGSFLALIKFVLDCN